MGWLWASTPTPKSSASADSAKNPQAAPASQTTQAADSPVDPEIQKFLSLLSAETGGKPEQKAPEPTPQTQSSSTSSSGLSSWFTLKSSPSSPSQTSARDAANPAPKLDPVAESLLPTEMSCRQAFDMAFHCQSVGGQWNAIYRGGGMRSCSETWDDFWFCMRVKGYSGQVKEEAIREHYRKKELAKYGPGMPSSQDVWTARTTKVAPGTAFTTALEENTVSDDEWQRREIERRRQVRQRLGFDEAAAPTPSAPA